MKSLKAQLVAAIAMTLVAALTIGSSTYAWFTMNQTVTATAMQVKASASDGLNIFTWNPTAQGTSPNYTAKGWTGDGSTAYSFHSTTSGSTTVPTTQTIQPVSTNTFKQWYTAKAGSGNSAMPKKVDGKTDEYFEAGPNTANYYPTIHSQADYYNKYYNSGYYLYDIYKISPATAEASNKALQLNSITCVTTDSTNLSAALNKSIRVMLRVSQYNATSGAWEVIDREVIAPNYTAAEGYPHCVFGGETTKVYGGAASEKTVAAFETGINKTAAPSGAIQLATKANETIVEVFIYYDGEDTNCMTANTSFGVDTIKCDLVFGQPTT